MHATALVALLATLLPATPGDGEPISGGNVALPAISQECRISMSVLVRLRGDDVGKGILRADSGGYWLVRYFAPFEIVRYDLRGRKQALIGRKGYGPKEFNEIRDVVPLGERLAVFQAEPARLTYLDADGEAMEDHLLPVAMRSVPVASLPDSTFLLSGDPLLAAASGAAFVQIDRRGRLLTTFGGDVAEDQGPLKGLILPRLLTFHPGVGPVSVKRYDLYIERWRPDGTLFRTQRREVDWFTWPPPAEFARNHSAGPPENLFFGAAMDDDDRLWLLARVTPEGWEGGIRDNAVVDEVTWADGFIHVADVNTGATLCSRQIDEVPLHGFVGERRIATYSEDESGNPVITVWNLDLVLSGPEQGIFDLQ